MKKRNFLCYVFDKQKRAQNMMQKRAQVSIFIIIAIVIVVGIVIYFSFIKGASIGMSSDMKEVYGYYTGCLEETTKQGTRLLGEQGGYIELPEFEPGTGYRGFSSQLDFFGQAVPYWFYVSGNDELVEQIPNKEFMEQELEKYVEERLRYCDFSDFETRGFSVIIEPEADEVSVSIADLNVEVNVKNKLLINFEDESVVVENHDVLIDTKLGKFYSLAKNVYEYEQNELFLEKYAIDVLRLYAPVTGVDLSCASKIFSESEIRENISRGLEENIPRIKLKGDYYDLNNKENEYFVSDIGVNMNENVNFVYSINLPTKIEIYGDLISKPVGLQQGLGILGFCYVPYHLVYDINFPVLVQFYDANEIFQFPVSVLIEKNQIRQAVLGEAGISTEPDVCEFMNNDISVASYDSSLNPVEARISFRCLNTECYIGDTKVNGNDAVLNGEFPGCVGGTIIARTEGYADTKKQINSNEESSVDVAMKKLYTLGLDVNNGVADSVLINMKSENHVVSVIYPETQEISLIEGEYDISVYAYENKSLVFPASSERKCVKVPKSGIGGFIGLEEEKCFNVEIPEQESMFVVIGGGVGVDYFAESQLEESEELNIIIDLFGTPSDLNEVQNNYLEIENSNVILEFR